MRLATPWNTLVENDAYTIRLASGERELIIEHTLAEIEGEYASVYRNKIIPRRSLTDEERATVAVFTAAMLSRPRAMREHHQEQWDEVRERVRGLEEAHGIPQGTSRAAREIEAIRPTIHADVIAMTLDVGAASIFRMHHTYLIAPAGKWFIASDAPCSMFSATHQGFYGPGLGQPDVEVFLPLSPETGLLATLPNGRGILERT